jgi:kynureninase
MIEHTAIDYAITLDEKDPLRSFRDEFVLPDENTIYLDGNSLGMLPRLCADRLHETIHHEWGNRLIRSWNESWIDLPRRLGAKIAHLIGAGEDEVLVCDATSINLFKLIVAALRLKPGRKTILSDVLNFPSDLYILQGAMDLLGQGHRIELIPSLDGISIAQDDLDARITEDTAVVCLSQVAFKSAYLYDMEAVTRRAHAAGAYVLWDLSHSAGILPINLSACQADMAVGCTYKYLNGGPGAPAYMYVRQDLQEQLIPPLWGWFGTEKQFEFALNYTPASGMQRFQVGTPPILSMAALEPALDLLLKAGIDPIRQKSVQQTSYLIELADRWLAPSGFSLGSPRQAERRGSHVSLRHPEAYRICRALIEASPPEVIVLPDFRAPDNIRLGIAPLYTRFIDIHAAMQRIREIVSKNEYLKYSAHRQQVT